MPVRMASVRAASLFSATLAAGAPAVADVAGPAFLHPITSAAAVAQPNTTAHRKAGRRGGAARNRLGASGGVLGSRLMSWPPFGVDRSEGFPDEGVFGMRRAG